MPARIMRSSTSGELDAGPMVATIRVLLKGNVAGSGDCILLRPARASSSPDEIHSRAVLGEFALPLVHRVGERAASADDGLAVHASGVELAGQEIG